MSFLEPEPLFEMAKESLTLAERFTVPPFSVLNARSDEWQRRKQAWLELGIESEVGRADNLLNFSDTVLEAQGDKTAGTSVFDPVVCELAYRWWSPPGGAVIDPFAGGSVRGIVAAVLGHPYTGIDLRPEQIAANEAQAAAPGIAAEIAAEPRWVCGDSRDLLDLVEGDEYDFLFSCPPYFDLEQYSDDPLDLSNAGDYREFKAAYQEIVHHACEALRPDRFACFVVGDLRDKTGIYHGLVPDTIRAFQAAGASYYNEAILVTSVGSVAIRAPRIFAGGRKLCKAHQNVLVFVKGDPKRAHAACGPLDSKEEQ